MAHWARVGRVPLPQQQVQLLLDCAQVPGQPIARGSQRLVHLQTQAAARVNSEELSNIRRGGWSSYKSS